MVPPGWGWPNASRSFEAAATQYRFGIGPLKGAWQMSHSGISRRCRCASGSPPPSSTSIFISDPTERTMPPGRLCHPRPWRGRMSKMARSRSTRIGPPAACGEYGLAGPSRPRGELDRAETTDSSARHRHAGHAAQTVLDHIHSSAGASPFTECRSSVRSDKGANPMKFMPVPRLGLEIAFARDDRHVRFANLASRAVGYSTR